jgi:hypothetical protein
MGGLQERPALTRTIGVLQIVGGICCRSAAGKKAVGRLWRRAMASGRALLRGGRSLRDLDTPSVGAPVGRNHIFVPTIGRPRAKPVYPPRSGRCPRRAPLGFRPIAPAQSLEPQPEPCSHTPRTPSPAPSPPRSPRPPESDPARRSYTVSESQCTNRDFR